MTGAAARLTEVRARIVRACADNGRPPAGGGATHVRVGAALFGPRPAPVVAAPA